MAVKDILLALTTYPEPTPISAVDEAIDFAAAVGARISAVNEERQQGNCFSIVVAHPQSFCCCTVPNVVFACGSILSL
jgi:hypothetical protein